MAVTLLNCIERIPSLIEKVLKEREEMFAGFVSEFGSLLPDFCEMVLVGSGTSSTAILTAQPFMERMTGIPVRLLLPGAAADEDTALPSDALYLFLSQTGTSALVQEAYQKLSAKGLACVTMTESAETDLAKMSCCHIPINCGKEEYGMRTIGYTISVLDLMLLGLVIAKAAGRLTEEAEAAYLEDAAKVPESLTKMIGLAHGFFERNRERFLSSDCIVFTGAKALYGLSLEGAVKFWEMPRVISIGYELEEGMHGPNYGYNSKHCVIVLNSGRPEEEKGLRLARYMKEIFHNGLIVGPEVIDADDLLFTPASEFFTVLEYSALPQVLAYDLAPYCGRNLLIRDDLSLMESYFSTHTHW